MQLQDYLTTLRRRWRTIVVTVAVFVLLGVYMIAKSDPTYSASAELFVAPGSLPGSNELVQGSAFYEDRVKTYALIVDSAIVLDPVIENLGLDMTSRRLASKVSATAPVDTVLLRINVTDGSPARAATIANAVAEQFVQVAPELESAYDPSADPVVRVTIVQPAVEPRHPIAPNKRMILVLCTMLGLAIGFAIAVVRELLDNRVRTEAHLRALTDVPVVGKIPQKERDEPLLVDETGYRAEAYRQLRTNLQFLDLSQQHHTFVITSALPDDGKSVTATNLALTIADAGHSVCLVEADLRRPGVNRLLDLEGEVGLTSVIVGTADLDDVIQPWGDSGVDVIAAGHLPPNPSELLSSDAMADLLDELRADYDFVIVDTPPLLAVTDAAILARHCGGAIVVISNRGRKTVTRQQLMEAFANLETAGTKVLGVVLSRLPTKGPDAIALSDYRYETRRDTTRRSAPDPDPSPVPGRN